MAFVCYSLQLGQMESGLENLEHSPVGAGMKDDYVLMTVIHNIRSHSNTRSLRMVLYWKLNRPDNSAYINHLATLPVTPEGGS